MTLAAVTLGEDPGMAQLGGAALILTGVVVATSGHRKGVGEPEGALIAEGS
jgi:drug/metabolite transporter (DMT)-like permease